MVSAISLVEVIFIKKKIKKSDYKQNAKQNAFKNGRMEARLRNIVDKSRLRYCEGSRFF